MAKKDNTGVLFKVTDKQSDKHPDMTGKCMVDGKKMEIAVWHNTSKDGKTKYCSLKFSEPFVKQTENNTTATSDEIPF